MLAVGHKGKEQGLFVRPGNQGWGEAEEKVTKAGGEGGSSGRGDKTRASDGDRGCRGQEMHKGKAGRGPPLWRPVTLVRVGLYQD